MSHANMTRKEAIKALYALKNAYVEIVPYEQYQQEEAFRSTVNDALALLTHMIYGKRCLGQYTMPCRCCWKRYAEDFVYEQGKAWLTWCCFSCRDTLQAEGKLGEEAQA